MTREDDIRALEPSRGGAQGRHGFSLVELIVAIAIVVTIMSGLVLLFTGSMRAIRQSQQAMQAFEVARSTLSIIERDLSTCFTARDYGEYYTFFGIPHGMTFVGVVGDREKSTNIHLSRITYVLREFNLDDPYGPVAGGSTFETTVPVTLVSISNPAEQRVQDVEARILTRTLLRYVEPNVTDLDTFPFPFPDSDPDWLESPPGEAGSPMYAVWKEMRDTVVRGGQDLTDVAAMDATGAQTATLFAELLKAKKRELWIRMLAGEAGLPDAWAYIGHDPADYVLAEDIVWQVLLNEEWSLPYLIRVEYAEDPGKSHFAYNDFRLLEESNHWGHHDLIDNNGNGEMDEVTGGPDGFGERRLYGFINFQYGRTGRMRRDARLAELISELAEVRDDATREQLEQAIQDRYRNVAGDDYLMVSQIEPFFNTERNLTASASLGSESVEADMPTFWEAQEGATALGNLLDPRLPELVQVEMRIMMPSPYPGAPDFSRLFSLQIDVPSGFVRSAAQDLTPAL
ncbi:MAG TPA: type II secretion system protein [Candidatus Hydrogenedentes bacterium]|nr:type II secretion system protein [Candidatus Hydrogenedentota bacterium]HPG68686.1 type II secretion system protein [Candidatus Hydrogenedentota bacterium]